MVQYYGNGYRDSDREAVKENPLLNRENVIGNQVQGNSPWETVVYGYSHRDNYRGNCHIETFIETVMWNLLKGQSQRNSYMDSHRETAIEKPLQGNRRRETVIGKQSQGKTVCHFSSLFWG